LDEDYIKITQNKFLKEKANSKLGNCWVSFYLDNVVTIRDCDWNYLKKYFVLPENPEEIDFTPIKLKTKADITTPKKANLNLIRSNFIYSIMKIFIQIIDLFSQR